jgi:hypothetical protein
MLKSVGGSQSDNWNNLPQERRSIPSRPCCGAFASSSWFETRKKELANRPLIREQAFGDSLDPDKLERLARYEVHLDRKLERTLSMLFRLKELRPATVES